MRSRYGELELSESELQRNGVPALALIGADDFRISATRTLVSVMANCEMKVVPGDHGSALAQPEFLEELRAFLREHATGR